MNKEAPWTITNEQSEQVCKLMDAVKQEYAEEIVEILMDLPPEHQQFAYYYARDVDMAVVFELAAKAIKVRIKNQGGGGSEADADKQDGAEGSKV